VRVDNIAGIPTEEEVEQYKAIDPLIVTESKILKNRIATQAELDQLNERIKIEIDEAVEFAENSDFPSASSLYDDNYVESNYPYIRD